ncbi:hypothetical protein [Cellulomonas soli]|uniref:Lipoprotein n=1 Tax=Cellulomonas soli TaxID=931535 RepID=A0A512PCD6_9CELL|nr:hypothetical protein [Cellulomonas soli]NYI58453.1 hypothetical protein [Cellulomonas soli]GEP68875.1 hypothetical protein CSO01_15900 [Cellulomonas soli]
MISAQRVLPAVLLLALLSGCGGGSDDGFEPSPAASAATSTSPSASVVAEPSGDPLPQEPARDLAEFRSESVQCVVHDTSVECQLQEQPAYEVPAELLEYGPPCTDVWLEATETEGTLGCPGDVLSETVPNSELLPVGAVVSRNGFTCTLIEGGARCTNEVGGLIEITAEAYRLTS